MPFFLLAAWRGMRRALVKDQRRPEPCALGFWQLLAREFPLVAKRVGPLKVGTIVVIFFVAVIAAEIALNEATPGPFLTPRWRVVVALAATIVFVALWTVIHAIRSVGFHPPAQSKRP